MLSETAIKSILSKVGWCDLPLKISYSLFPIPGTPSSNYGLINKVIQFSHGSWDARTPSQWKKCSRYLMKGIQDWSIPLIVPQLANKETEDGVKKVLKGYTSVQIYDQKCTYGNEVEVQTPRRKIVDIKEISQRWSVDKTGLSSEYEVTSFWNVKKYREPNGEKAFFWSVVNKAYRELYSEDPDTEKRILVEEIAALALLRLCSFTVEFNGNRHYGLIEAYARARKLSSIAALFTLLKRLEEVLKCVLEHSVIRDV